MLGDSEKDLEKPFLREGNGPPRTQHCKFAPALPLVGTQTDTSTLGNHNLITLPASLCNCLLRGVPDVAMTHGEQESGIRYSRRTSFGFLSSRSATNFECRRWPSGLHSTNSN